jgi:hypothetical protein
VPGPLRSIDRYGQGLRPRIDGAGQVEDAARLHNVQFIEVRNLEVTTDAAGKFEFANVDPGDYQLTIRRDGLINLVLGAKNAAHKTDPILLNAGDPKADFLVRLVPYGSIGGSTFDQDGDPSGISFSPP